MAVINWGLSEIWNILYNFFYPISSTNSAKLIYTNQSTKIKLLIKIMNIHFPQLLNLLQPYCRRAIKGVTNSNIPFKRTMPRRCLFFKMPLEFNYYLFWTFWQ